MLSLQPAGRTAAARVNQQQHKSLFHCENSQEKVPFATSSVETVADLNPLLLLHQTQSS